MTKTRKETKRSRPLIWLLAGTLILVSGAGAWKMLRRPTHKHHAAPPPSDVVSVGQTRPRPSTEIPDAWKRARAQVALTMKTEPQKLSPTGRPEPFNQAAFEHDPEAYLSRIEPGRCFQTARPVPGAFPLGAAVPLRKEVVVNDATLLMVKTLPNAPVTFTIFEGGYFKENGVNSVTVRADGRGLAQAHYAADPGTSGDVSVVAGSPVAVGNQRFFIRVNPSSTGT